MAMALWFESSTGGLIPEELLLGSPGLEPGPRAGLDPKSSASAIPPRARMVDCGTLAWLRKSHPKRVVANPLFSPERYAVIWPHHPPR